MLSLAYPFDCFPLYEPFLVNETFLASRYSIAIAVVDDWAK